MDGTKIEIENLKEQIKQMEELLQRDAELFRELAEALNRELDYRNKGRLKNER